MIAFLYQRSLIISLPSHDRGVPDNGPFMRSQNERGGELDALRVGRKKNLLPRPRWEGYLSWPAAKIERHQQPLICLGPFVAQHIFINRDGAIRSMRECRAGAAQRNQPAVQRQHGPWVLSLHGDVDLLIVRDDGEPRYAVTEACSGRSSPLHGRTLGVASDT